MASMDGTSVSRFCKQLDVYFKLVELNMMILNDFK